MRVVFYIFFFFRINYQTQIVNRENHKIEVIWTLLPGIILILIAFPSLRLLYLSEENEISPISIKIIGHQWYWSYEYSNFKEIEFDSFIKQTESSQFRLLETDNSFFLPEKIYSQLFISSTDVLHSWTIPRLRVKVDSAPGRLNSIRLYRNKNGIFFGQCSEICGANHRFMPISLQIIPFSLFKHTLTQLISLNSYVHWSFNSTI